MHKNITDENFTSRLLANGKKPTRVPEITHSEIITIILLYHQSRYDDLKSFYQNYLKILHKSDFPKLPSYDRFIALKQRVLWYLMILLQRLCEQAKIQVFPILIQHLLQYATEREFQKTTFLPKLLK